MPQVLLSKKTAALDRGALSQETLAEAEEAAEAAEAAEDRPMEARLQTSLQSRELAASRRKEKRPKGLQNPQSTMCGFLQIQEG
jgi:hypothetical protein